MKRRIATTVLTLGVAALLAMPAGAQQPKHKGHGSRMPMGGGAGLIANQDVQKELKLTKEQTSKAEAGAPSARSTTVNSPSSTNSMPRRDSRRRPRSSGI